MVREVVFWMILVCLVNMCSRINVVAQEIKLGTEKKITRIEWSPDGNMLAYVVSEQVEEKEVKSSIWLMDVNSGTKKLLTDKGYHNFGLSWSPDGKKIAFSVAKTLTHPKLEELSREMFWMYLPPRDIWVINVNGTGLKQLTSRYSSIEPVWSPDGKKIAYASITYPKYGNFAYGLHVMDANGTNRKTLTRPRVEVWEDIPIGWSHDGKKIIYHETGYERSFAIIMINIDGSGRKILDKGYYDFAVSSDMQKIVYIEGVDEVWIFDRTTNRKWRLTFDEYVKGHPQWLNEEVISFVEWNRDTDEDKCYLKIINIRTKKELGKFRIGIHKYRCPYKVSPDGRKVAIIEDVNNIKIINLERILKKK